MTNKNETWKCKTKSCNLKNVNIGVISSELFFTDRDRERARIACVSVKSEPVFFQIHHLLHG